MIAGAVSFTLLLMLLAVNMGRREIYLDVVGETLLISRKDLFGVKQTEVHRSEIERVHVHMSFDQSTARQAVHALIIGRRGGQPLRLLSHMPEKPLESIAKELHRALALDDNAPDALMTSFPCRSL